MVYLLPYQRGYPDDSDVRCGGPGDALSPNPIEKNARPPRQQPVFSLSSFFFFRVVPFFLLPPVLKLVGCGKKKICVEELSLRIFFPGRSASAFLD